MSHPRWDQDALDMDLLAGYVDGTLSPEERRKAEHVLATSEAAREVVAEAIRLKADLDPVPAARPQAPSRRRWGWAAPLLAAAAATALILIPSLRPGAPASGALPPEVFGALPDGWRDRSWNVTRAFRTALSPEVTAFRAGTLWTDALLAWEAGDTEEARSLLAPLAQMLDAVPTAATAATLVREAEALAASGTPLDQATDLLGETEGRLSETLPAGLLATGRWLESVRLALLAGRGDLLASGGALGAVPAEAEAAVPPSGQADLDALRVIGDEGAPGEDAGSVLLRHVLALQALLGA